MSKRNRGYLTAYAISYLCLVAAIAIRGTLSGLEPGLAVGAAFSLVIGIAAIAVGAQRRRRAEHTSSTEA